MAHRAPNGIRRRLARAALAAACLLAIAAPSALATDSTRPNASWVQWTESSPYAWYNAGNSATQLWYNPLYSGSATARIAADDPDSGIDFVTFGTGPVGWSPGGNTSVDVGGGNYEWTYTWSSGAVAGGFQGSASHTDPVPSSKIQSVPPVNYTVAADDQPPTASNTTVTITDAGWKNTATGTVTFPPTSAFTDAGSSAPGVGSLHRYLQYRPGIPDGLGGCDASAGTWSTFQTNPPGTSATFDIPASDVCWEIRYRIVDEVGNPLDLAAPSFRGLDTTPGTVLVTNISYGSNPQYQYLAGTNVIYVNGNFSGGFTVETSPSDAVAGVGSLTFEGMGAGWGPATNSVVATPGPWTQAYTWSATVTDPGSAQRIGITDIAGNFQWIDPTHTIIVDSGGIAVGSATLDFTTPPWRDTTSVDVTMAGAMSDTQSGIASYQLQREQAAWTGGAGGSCTAFTGSYTNIGAAVYGSPPPAIGTVTDTGVADGTCYRYRVEATDHVGNVDYLAPATEVMVDDTDPTGAFDALAPFASTAMSISGTAADTMSGLGGAASVTVRVEDMSSPGPTTALFTDTSIAAGTFGPWSWDTSALSGPYRLHLDVTDRAGNTTTGAATFDVLVDNTAPTLAFDGFTEGSSPTCQHVDAGDDTLAWVRTSAPCSGDIIARFAPADGESGIDHVTAPAAPAGWTPASDATVASAPWQQTYAWNTGATDLGTLAATATSGAGLDSASASFTIATDNDDPTGGSVAYPTGWVTSAPITVSVTGFSDAGAGLYHQQLLRDEVPRTAADCGAGEAWPDAWSTVVGETVAGDPNQALPATIDDSAIATGTCYRYRLVATDNVGNTATTTTTPVAAATDLNAPLATIDTLAPVSPLQGTVTLTGTATDTTSPPASGVATVTLRWEHLGNSSTGTIGSPATPSPTWSLPWTTGVDGSYRIHVDVTDAAGNTTTSVDTRDVTVDNSPPSIDLVSFTPGSLPGCQHWNGLPSTTFWFSTTGVGCGASDFSVEVSADDQPGGLADVEFPAWADVHPTGTGPSLPEFVTSAPFTSAYSYTSGAAGPGAADIVAHGNSGLSTTLATRIVLDDTGPDGYTFTGPGATSGPGWWTSAGSANIGFDVSAAGDPVQGGDPGSGVRSGDHELQRRETTDPACASGWSTWSSVAAGGPSSPVTDSTIADGTCYQYRLGVFDNTNNVDWVADTASQLRVDHTDPTGTITPPPAYVRGSSIALAGTAGDDWSGVAAISVRIGTGPATACLPTVAASWSCTWDTTAAPNGATTLTLELTDAAGNVVDADTVPTYVDNELPAGSVTLTAGTNGQWQHVVPGPTPRIYVNTDEAGGDFTAAVAASDGFSGVYDVAFPDLLTGWSAAGGTVAAPGPYEFTYTWTGPAAADPGAVAAVVQDNAFNAATAPFEVVADVDDPTSTSLDYDGGPVSTPSITFAEGSDAGSGLATWSIERRETAVTGPGTCDTGAWSGWTSQVTDPAASPWTDSGVALNSCYQYRIVATDRVGNAVTVGDPEGDTVSVEPAGIVVTETGSTEVVEGGATDTYQVRLRTIPSAPVTVTIGNPDGQVLPSSPTLSFTPATWNVDQTVTVTAADDDVDEVPDPHAGTLTHVAASGDTDYDALAGPNVVASITDDDDAGIIVSADAASVAVAEAGATTDTYTIVLESEPTDDVVVTLTTPDGQVTASPSTITFTAGDWSAPKTVTVQAVDDPDDEPVTHPGVVVHAVSSSDPLYDPLTIGDVTASVADDDTSAVTVTPVAGLALDEAAVGTTAQYTVVLETRPTGDVTINVAGDAQATPDVTSLLFTTTDWNTPKPVTLTVVDDLVVEGAHTSTASHLSSSIGDSNYDGIAVAPVVVDVADNDVPGIEVTPAGPLATGEGSAPATYQVRLESQPVAQVDIAFTTDSQVDPIATLSFDATTWNTFQDVIVTAVDDDVDEGGSHASTISHVVTSGDANYDGWVLADMLVDIADDDVAAVIVDDAGGVDVDEANLPATGSFTVRLDSEPTADVTVSISDDAQLDAAPATLTFTPTNWASPQPVTVTAVDDDVDEADPHPGTISFVVGGDPQYDLVVPTPLVADVADDDDAGITVSPGTLALDETLPADDTYTIVLESQPVSDVTIDLTDDGQVNAAPSSITFTDTNWSNPATVTVEAVDDPLVEVDPHPGLLTHAATSADPLYDGATIADTDASIVDNDVPGITVDEGAGVEATENGASGSYTIVLDRQPTGDVTVDLTDDTQVDATPTSVTFTNATWNSPQTITVAAQDDDVDEVDPHPGIVSHVASSTDPLWSGVTAPADVTVDVHDDDVADIVVTHSSPYALSEDTPADTVSYDVRLATQPTSDVTITLTVPGDLQADQATLTFTDTTWASPQTVTVNAVDDSATELPSPVHQRTITHAVASGDPAYAALTVPDIDFDVTDNDIPGITVDRTSLAATEGGTGDTFTIVLETQPASDVTIDLTGTQVGFDVDPIVFTTTDWNTPKPVQVDAIDDDVDEGTSHAGLVQLAVTSGDPVYDAWTLTDIPVDVTDDDVAGITVTPGSGTPLDVAEAGTTSDAYTIVLDSEPTAPVDITIATGDGQTSTDVTSITLDDTTWSTGATVNVTALDDQVDEADPHPALVTHTSTSADPAYDAATIDDQAVDVADDDDAAVVVTPVSGLALDEADPATPAVFSVVLGSEPTGPVTITLDTPDLQSNTDAPTLTFDDTNWSTAQPVTVTVVDDDVDETSTHAGTVEVGVASGGDPNYDAIDPTDVTLDIDDDDTAGVIVAETGGSTDVDEASTTDTYSVVLETQPVSDVTITITGGADATADAATLTFTDADWDQPQDVTVSGTPDALVEGPHTQLFTHASSSLDPNYDGIAVTIADVVANVVDDDLAGATITPTSLATAEGGAPATYTVVLDAEPTAPVDVAITTDPEVATDLSTLTFTPSTWSDPQTVTVTAVDDLVTEPSPHTGTVSHAMSSSDGDFDAVPASDVTIDIDDNDIPGVTITPTALTTAEGGTSASFDVVLDSIPGDDVDVSFTESGQLDPIATITFTPATWDDVQTVSVSADDDLVMEGPHTTTITVDTASLAPAYDTGALTIPDVTVDIADNDTAGVLLAPATGLGGTEGDTVAYAMSLTSEPTDDVTITLAGDADGTPAATTYTFTSSDWATTQQVDVDLVQDLIAEGAHTTTITGTTSAGTDAFYGAVAVPDQSIDITDDDVAGVTFTPALPGPMSIAEGGAPGSYDVVLDTEPTDDVTIDLVALAGQAIASPATLTFGPGDWSDPQTVSVTADDDQIAETTPHFDTMTHTAGGLDPVYAALTLGDLDLEIDDDDVPGVRIDATAGATAVTEGGTVDTVEVVLESRPTADVDVTLTSSQVDLSTTTVTFTDANWSDPQVVTVTAIDDDVFEGSHAGTIDAVTASSGDSFYAGVAALQHDVDVTDDDTAGVVITPPAANTLDEQVPTPGRTYQVRLQSEPVAPVDVTIATDGQVDTGGVTTLTFAPGTWNVDQDVVVMPVDDSVAESTPHAGVVSHDTDSVGDPAYATGTLTIDDVSFDIADNDTQDILVSQATGHVVAEGGGGATYDIVLASQPTSSVTLAPVSTQLQWSVADITFTTGNWDQPQTVTLEAIDDQVDELDPHPGTLDMTVTSGDAVYASLTPPTVDASIGDDDVSDLVATPGSGLVVDEAGGLGAATYTLTLTSIPSGPVDVTITADAQVAASPTSVTLDAANWNTGVTVDVTAIDDDVDEGDPHPGTLGHELASSDPNFDAETGPDQVVDVLDDDTAGVTVTASAPDTTVAEDGSSPDTYEIVLESRPTADVTIAIAGDTEVEATQASLTFDDGNWDQPQVVDVDATDDFRIEGPHTGTFTHVATSADPGYDAIPIADEVANVLDDDAAGVVVTPDGGTFEIAEGGTGDTLNVQLTSEPAADVTIDLATADGESTTTPSQVVLDATNWNTGVDVAVDAVDDGYIEASPHAAVVSLAIDAGSDPDYVGVTIADAIADVTDNDSADVAVDVLDGIALDEADLAATDTIEVRLLAAPAPGESVDVTITTDPLQLTASPATVTFDDGDWSTAQPVTLTAVDDDIDEADPHTSAISFATSSGDTDFDALAVADVDASIADDDTAGIVVDTSTVAIAEAGPTSGDVLVRLASEPVADVEVDITFDPAQVAVTTPTTLTFTPADWDSDQLVTVEAVDDPDDEADQHPSTITLAASSVAAGDPAYDAAATVDVTAGITDDDTSAVAVTSTGGTEVEEADGAATMTWEVVLETRPSGDVTIDLVPDAQLEVVGATTLTFTPSDWSTPKPIEVRAADDDVDEADPHPGLLAFSMGGLDPAYAALVPTAETVDVRDDDTAGVTVTQLPAAPQQVAEDGTGGAASYEVVLDSEPIDDVTITLSTDAQVDSGATTDLVFQPADWDQPQVVAVTAVDDQVTEPTPHPGTITHASDSLDPAYALVAGLTIADATFDVVDDDVAGFTLAPAAPAPSVDEADVATTASYELSIDTIPAGPVTVDLASTTGDVTVSPASHTFDAANAADPVQVTVTAVDDDLPEASPHVDTITHVLDPGSDATYLSAPPIPDVDVDVADDDVAALLTDDGGGIALDEADVATTATFDLVLGAEPVEDVDVAIDTADGQTTVDQSSVTFTPADWDTPRTIEVTVVDDALTEPDPHTGTITFTTSSIDAPFDAMVVPDLQVDIADDDIPQFVVVDSPDTTLDEADVAGTERTMSIALATAPSSDVTVDVTADGQLGLQSLPSLTFTSTTWSTPQDVVVRAIDDQVAEADPHAGVLGFAVDPASDAGYAALTIGDRSFDIADDDAAAVSVACTGAADWAVNGAGNVDLSEVPADAAHDVTCDLELGTDAAQPVTIDVTTDTDQLVVDQPSVTIPAGSRGPVPLTFTAVDDAIDEADPHASVATFAVSSPDSFYDGLPLADVTFDIADDDSAGVTITPPAASSPQLAEDGSIGPVTYDAVLDSAPTDTVTVTPDPGPQLQVTPASLDFDAGDWSTPKQFTVTAIDDAVDEADPHPGTISHDTSSTDPAYDAGVLTIADVALDIADDDTPGFTLAPAAPAPALDEADVAATESWTLSIDTVPVGTVSVALGHGADVDVTPAVAEFTSATTSVTVTVAAVDDALVEGPHGDTITHTVNAPSDAAYDGYAISPIAVTVADDDSAGLVVDDGGGVSLDEADVAATGTIQVALQAEPAAPVDVTVAGDAQVDATPTTLTFTPGNWAATQPVTVAAVDDLIVEGPHSGSVSFSTSSADTDFDALTVPDATIAIADDDSPAVLVSTSGTTMDEADPAGTQQLVHVRLSSMPTTPVTITASNDGQNIFTSAPLLVLDAGNWATGVDLPVRAFDDMVAELDPHPGTISFAVSPGSDPDYASLAVAPVVFQIADDDAANASLACNAASDWNLDGAGRLQLTEDIAAPERDAACRLDIGTEPAAPVTIDIAVTNGSDLTASTSQVVIPAGTQPGDMVTFTVTDDALVEGAETARIDFTVTTTDPVYSTMAIPSVDVDIADDDTPGVTVTPAGPLALAEGAPGQAVTVQLDSQPANAVTIDLAGTQVAALPSTLTFVPGAWDTPQTVTITAIDDAIDEPDGHAGLVALTAASADAAYDGIAIPQVDVTITDDDVPGVLLVESGDGTSVAEGGAGDTLTIQLGTIPAFDVTVTVSGDAQVAATPATLTFTPADWNDPQTIDLAAVQDSIVEGDHLGNVTFSLDSADVAYMSGSASTPPAVSVAVADDDSAGIVVVESDAATQLSEGGTPDTYTIALSAQPDADVAVAVDGGTQVAVSPASVTFTAANWSDPQTITVNAIQDTIDETDPHAANITHVATTTATGWSGVELAGVTASIVDDDTAAIVVTQTDDSTQVTEGALTGDTISFRLATQPSADVLLEAAGDEQLEVPTEPIKFSSANWGELQTLSVRAVDDEEVEDDHQGVVIFKVTSDDPNYGQAKVTSIVVKITDNDLDAGVEDDEGLDDEEDEEFDDGGIRAPREVVPPATTRPNSRTQTSTGGEQRTPEGIERTPEGNSRLPAGTDDPTAVQPGGKRSGERLGGEVVASSEEEADERLPLAKAASKWVQDNWKLAVPLALTGLTLLALAGKLLGSDPMRMAQKAAGSKAALDAGQRAARAAKHGSRHHPHPRVRRKRKKDDDEDDEDGDGRGPKRRPRKR